MKRPRGPTGPIKGGARQTLIQKKDNVDLVTGVYDSLADIASLEVLEGQEPCSLWEAVSLMCTPIVTPRVVQQARRTRSINGLKTRSHDVERSWIPICQWARIKHK